MCYEYKINNSPAIVLENFTPIGVRRSRNFCNDDHLISYI